MKEEHALNPMEEESIWNCRQRHLQEALKRSISILGEQSNGKIEVWAIGYEVLENGDIIGSDGRLLLNDRYVCDEHLRIAYGRKALVAQMNSPFHLLMPEQWI